MLIMASGLLSSIAITACGACRAYSISRTPSTIPAARSRISRSSQVMYGSHSAPLTARVCTLACRALFSLSAAGKLAPPIPTIPASAMWTAICSGTSANGSGSGSRSSQRSSPSLSRVMVGSGNPETWGAVKSPIALIVPEVGA